MSLDTINDGENNEIQVDKTGDYSRQFWKITKIETTSKKDATSKDDTPKATQEDTPSTGIR